MKDLLQTPFSSVKNIFFTGIGGIGMSGLAELFLNLGYNVQGSDIKENSIIERLRKRGVEIAIGQQKENIKNADILVVSSAIKEDNEEYVEAVRLGIPIFKRSKMLAELMRFKWSIAVAGTHGKTTTTSLISHIMHYAKLDPTAIIGGIVNSWGQNSRFGDSNWLVAESDESDGSFLDLPATISVVTNIEEEHMEHYGTYGKLKSDFVRFINSIPFVGFSVLCIDNSGVQDILPFVKQRKIITYGVSPQADYRIVNIDYSNQGVSFDVESNIKGVEKIRKGFYLPMFGVHNVLNATAAIVVSENIGIEEDTIKEALKEFKGVNRRFTNIGSVGETVFIDDYAHHPSEIEAVINAANKLKKEDAKIISIVQPHRYTRLRDHFENFCKCFNGSDFVIILDVYKAGEEPIEGYSAENLVVGIQNYGHKNVIYVKEAELVDKLTEILANNKIEMSLFMGAGDITNIAQRVFNKMSNNK
ncbi:MAG: UDP-N-acetylmuramate--L-alanine ligase [Alphaproteobacteria bacterium]|jgi:UDP-N-acetylmuramate--alanine ligase|nr:UDP-N-acetylmuramate--L-alanine ligase [Alphaproteobacteria bacterium]